MEYNFKKVCEKCRKKLPATPEYFTVNHENKSKLSQNCRECSPETERRTRTPSKKRVKHPIVDGQKFCVKCEQMKKVEEFPLNKSMLCGYDSYCRKCHRDIVVKYYEFHPQKYDPSKITQRVKSPKKWYRYLKKYNKKYAKDPLKRKKLSLAQSVWKHKNAGHISQPITCECQECGNYQQKLRSWFPDDVIFSFVQEKKIFGLEIIKEHLKWLCNKCLYSKRAKPKKKG
jgi:hypothetical protein